MNALFLFILGYIVYQYIQGQGTQQGAASGSEQVPGLLDSLAETVGQSMTFSKIAAAIQQMEGWYPGSVSFTNNNPGNLRFENQPGAIGQDSQHFAIFATVEDGQTALLALLQHDASAHPDWTLAQLMSVYSPSSDNNNPTRYAEFIATQAGGSVTDTLGSLSS